MSTWTILTIPRSFACTGVHSAKASIGPVPTDWTSAAPLRTAPCRVCFVLPLHSRAGLPAFSSCIHATGFVLLLVPDLSFSHLTRRV
ncbi:hypothetical protein CALCODRAFT_504988 [Calocera cornea HHB12733]|uniref:Uncharacterized protein n=1 Tax=Calocera cornea HHB12733 TaxID=1353952 RepID=A0A165C2Z7_9BASI|nr:hypothetical protein CALCODRAFT_504988 [Calocera cornea HHB12733]